MADVLTTRLKMTKPDVGGSDDTWGSKLNTDWDVVDRVYRDLTGELVSTSGTGTAHDVVLTHTDYADIDSTLGFRLAIRSGYTNTGAMTLNVGDGNGARPVNKFLDGVQVALASGDFPIHYPGDFIYIRRSGFSGWILLNPATGVGKAPSAASETVVGITRFATNLEAQGATLGTVALTPKNLAVVGGTVLPDASTTVKGKIEIATIAEAGSGTSAPLAVNPEGLAVAVNTWVPNATSSTAGKIAIATNAEALAGTIGNEAITPVSLDYVFNERVGTTTKRGSTSFATTPEGIDGALFNKAINPAVLKNVMDAAMVVLLDGELLKAAVDARLKQHGLIPE